MSKIELVQIDENNYTIGESKIKFIENKTFDVTPVGELTYEIINIYENLCNKRIQLDEDKVCYLGNISKLGKIAPKAIRVLKRMSFHPKVDKIAVYGVNPVTRAVLSFIVGIKPKNNIRLFDTKEQAVSWLKEQN